MAEYLGETIINQEDSPYKNYTPTDWALMWIGQYGGIDGSHHKNWVLDHAARSLHGTKVIIKLAKWSNGQEEYKITLDEPTQEYKDWVKELKSGEDGPDTYGYNEGVCP